MRPSRSWVVACCVVALGGAGSAWVRSGGALPATPPELPLGALPARLWVTAADGARFELGSLRGIPTVLLFFRGAG